jgi:hypothetical protein
MPGGGMTTTASIPPTVRWLIATVLTAFGGIAVAVALEGAERFKGLRGGLGLVFLLSFATIFNWIAFGPGERHFSRHTTFGIGGDAMTVSTGESELTGRVVFGIVAFAVNLMIAIPLVRAIGRRLHRSGR